ncbi:MAG: hypothetical protein RL662_977 [Bacteroidota bacterium]|jgi:hypothetical protein
MKVILSISFIFIFALVSQLVQAQSKLSLMPGIYYNGTGLDQDVRGGGFIMGLEYMPHRNHFFSLELRTRYGLYTFSDETNATADKNGIPIPPKNPSTASLKYSLFHPQVGVVPKFHFHVDESLSLFLENEIAVGVMTGRFTYKGHDKKSFAETSLTYNIGAGVEYKTPKWTIVGSVGYSTLNFRPDIVKHQPPNYQEWIPNQHAGLLINAILKIPLTKK